MGVGSGAAGGEGKECGGHCRASWQCGELVGRHACLARMGECDPPVALRPDIMRIILPKLMDAAGRDRERVSEACSHVMRTHLSNAGDISVACA